MKIDAIWHKYTHTNTYGGNAMHRLEIMLLLMGVLDSQSCFCADYIGVIVVAAFLLLKLLVISPCHSIPRYETQQNGVVVSYYLRFHL